MMIESLFRNACLNIVQKIIFVMHILALTLVLSAFTLTAHAMQFCDFLSNDYFVRESAASEVSGCLRKGYTFAIVDTETKDTPLHIAVRTSDDPFIFDQLALLISEEDREKLISSRNAEGLNPFHSAVASGRATEVIVRLSKWGDVVDSRIDSSRDYTFNIRGTTALHLAVGREVDTASDLSLILALLAIGADPGARDGERSSPFEHAVGAANEADLALILDQEAWRERRDAFVVEMENAVSYKDCGRLLSGGFFVEARPAEIYYCAGEWMAARSEPASFWRLVTESGDNALHLLLKTAPVRPKVDALLAAAHGAGTLEAALASENGDGYLPIHIAADQTVDPLVIVLLHRWGADINHLANAKSNGFLQQKTGTSPLHLAAQRTDGADLPILTALLAVGANPDVFDNRADLNPLAEDVGLAPVDYLARREATSAMALIAPRFSVCEVASRNAEAVAAVVGLGAGAVGATAGAAVATSTAGLTVVTHSSGAVILTGSAGYIAGTLGTLGTGALAFLTAPATITASVVSVVALGGTVLYCAAAS